MSISGIYSVVLFVKVYFLQNTFFWFGFWSDHINSLRLSDTHLCISKLTIIGSDNGLSPDRCQAIAWTNAGILFIGHFGTNFSEILTKIHTFLIKKVYLKISSGKWRPSWLGFNVLKFWSMFCLSHYSAVYNITSCLTVLQWPGTVLYLTMSSASSLDAGCFSTVTWPASPQLAYTLPTRDNFSWPRYTATWAPGSKPRG